MAFGNKARQIKQLEVQVAACKEHNTFIPLAQEIGTRVAALAARQSEDMEAVMDAVLADASEAERQRLLVEHFKALPAETRLAALSAYFTDEETRIALETERRRLVARDETERAILNMRSESIDCQRVNLAAVPKGAQLLIDLYDKDDFSDITPKILRQSYVADRTLTAASLGEGAFQVLRDEANGDAKPKLKIHEIVRLGGALSVADETSHLVYYGADLNCVRAGKEKVNSLETDAAYLGIGFISVNGHEVMGPGTLPGAAEV